MHSNVYIAEGHCNNDERQWRCRVREAIALARSFSKHGNKTSVAVFWLHDNKTLVVDAQLGETGPLEAAAWDEAMANNEPRYVLANLAYDSVTDGVRRSACIFIMYVPGGSTIKQKIVATMSCKPVQPAWGRRVDRPGLLRGRELIRGRSCPRLSKKSVK